MRRVGRDGRSRLCLSDLESRIEALSKPVKARRSPGPNHRLGDGRKRSGRISSGDLQRLERISKMGNR
jgi:hypothetical protein